MAQPDHESLIAFARAEDGSTASITEVTRGRACNCTCFACKRPMVAKQGRIRVWSFSHAPGAGAACDYAAETALHVAMKELIEAEGAIFLPGFQIVAAGSTSFGEKIERTREVPGKYIKLQSVRLEYSVHPIRPDVVATSDGRDLFIEVFVTHACDPAKIAHIQSLGVSAIEIDLRKHDRTIDRTTLRRLLLTETPEKTWLYHAGVQRILDQLKALVAAEIEEKNKEITLRISQGKRPDAPKNYEERRPVTKPEETEWSHRRNARTAGARAKMRIPGPALCYELTDGGHLFLHPSQEGSCLLEVSLDAAWITAELAALLDLPEALTELWHLSPAKQSRFAMHIRNISERVQSL